MVIDTTVRDPKVSRIFEPAARRVRERGQRLARELKNAS